VRDQQLQQDERWRLGVSQGDQDGRKLDEGVGVVRQTDPVVPQDVAQNGERNPAGLIAGDIPLQPVEGPDVVEREPREAKVGLVSAMASHLVFFFFFSYLRKKYPEIIAMQREIYAIISYNFRLIGL
jgi:hypothetical protein